MNRPLPIAFACLAFAACSRPVSAAETPVERINGRDLSGWVFVTEPATDISATVAVAPGGVLAVTGQPIGYLATTMSHANYRLHVEWRWTAQPGNGGILLHISSGPKDRQWPQCFQIQLKHTRAGDVLPMAGGTLAELPTPEAKQVDRHADSSEKPPGEWNTCDVICRGDTIECTINGVVQNRVTHCAPAAGAIGFQLEGTPFELRALRLETLE